MESSKLDIWAIQHNPDEIDTALDNITDSATNILYTNCISKLKIGGRVFKIEFDTMFQSEENDMLILIMRGSKVTVEDLKRKLAERGITYNEIVFENSEYQDYDNDLKEIWFARDESVLKDALNDSKKKGNDVARYNPVIKGKLSFKYFSRQYLETDGEPPIETFERIRTRGMIETDDKIILLVNSEEDRNIYYKQALKVLSNTGMTPVIEDYESYEQKEKSKVKIKTNKS